MNLEREPYTVEAKKEKTLACGAELKIWIVLQSPPRSKEDLLELEGACELHMRWEDRLAQLKLWQLESKHTSLPHCVHLVLHGVWPWWSRECLACCKPVVICFGGVPLLVSEFIYLQP